MKENYWQTRVDSYMEWHITISKENTSLDDKKHLIRTILQAGFDTSLYYIVSQNKIPNYDTFIVEYLDRIFDNQGEVQFSGQALGINDSDDNIFNNISIFNSKGEVENVVTGNFYELMIQINHPMSLTSLFSDINSKLIEIICYGSDYETDENILIEISLHGNIFFPSLEVWWDKDPWMYDNRELADLNTERLNNFLIKIREQVINTENSWDYVSDNEDYYINNNICDVNGLFIF